MTNIVGREIKFRAWDGARFWLDDFYIDRDGLIYIEKEEKWNSYLKPLKDWKLMQYTGLKDKRGVEIYEGDIVVYDSSTETYKGERGIGEVKDIFQTANLAFWWIKQETDKPSLFSEINYFKCEKELEIIGNIHENPELLNE